MHLIATYGTLRVGQRNYNYYLKDKSEYLGTILSDPSFTMYSIMGAYPGICKNGTTRIVLDVFRVSDEVSKQIDFLEGYSGKPNKSNLYNKIQIDTKWGKAFIYVFNQSIVDRPIVESGDWVSFVKDKYVWK